MKRPSLTLPAWCTAVAVPGVVRCPDYPHGRCSLPIGLVPPGTVTLSPDRDRDILLRPLQQVADLRVGRLRKILVPEPDCLQWVRRAGAHRLVRHFLELGTGFGRAD